MTISAINSRRELNKWLEDNHGFDHGRILHISPQPGTPDDPPPETAELKIVYDIKGNYRAGTKMVYRVLMVRLRGITEFSLAEGGSIHPDNWSEGFEIPDRSEPIALTMFAPGLFTIACQALEVEQLPDLVETVQPYLSDREFSATVPDSQMPLPSGWLGLFNAKGLSPVWHILYGEPKPIEKVPTDNYEGWFLQLPEELEEHKQGLFFFSCKPVKSGFYFSMQDSGAPPALWRAAKEIAGEFPDVQIQCGNCTLTGPEWLKEIGSEGSAKT